MTPAPIALFVYNRPRHTFEAVDSLSKNELAKESDLVIFADAPKNPAADKLVNQVREYIRTITGFKSVSIFERPRNFGLAGSIIEGVTRMVNQCGRVIVLEDDLVTSRGFLQYMNDGLNFYENEERVISIHGYVYPIKHVLPETFFLRGADCWGWATWKRGWDLFESDGRKLLSELRLGNSINRFDYNGTVNYVKMLKRQIKGKNDSWAIRWHASAFLKNRLTLYPGVSLVQNIGMDGTGEHCRETGSYDSELSQRPISVGSIDIGENTEVHALIEDFFRNVKIPIVKRIRHRLRKWRDFHAAP